MIFSSAAQGTEAWKIERAGVITGSVMSEIITPTGKLSSSHKKVAARLAAEIITGRPLTKEFITLAMAEGSHSELLAAESFNRFTENRYETCGLVFLDDFMRVGVSPDLVLFDGLNKPISGCEMKNPMPHTHINYLSGEKCPLEYWPQVQACMWVLDTDHWWFQSLHDGFKPLRIMVGRDEKYIETMAEHCEATIELTDRLIIDYQEAA